MPESLSRSDHCVVQYLYIHAKGDEFAYTTSRAITDPRRLATLYLECALVQAGSLALRAPGCQQILVTNLEDAYDPNAIGRRGVALIKAIEGLGVDLHHAEYTYRFRSPAPEYASSRYVLDAMRTAAAIAPDHQYLWFTDVDCVWVEPDRVFASAPPSPQIGCLVMDYPPDWDIMLGTTPTSVGELGKRLGPSVVPAPWVGGELFGGTAEALRALLSECAGIERELGELPRELPAEEHLFTLAGAVGRVVYKDLSSVGRRLFTGRHTGPKVPTTAGIGVWHLPGEKGLSFRRTANHLLAGDHDRVAEMLSSEQRRREWFNLSPRLDHRLRDASRLVAYRLAGKLSDKWRKMSFSGAERR